MARTVRNTAEYAKFQLLDNSRKPYQCQVNKRFRQQTRQALRTEGVLPVVRREVDRLAH